MTSTGRGTVVRLMKGSLGSADDNARTGPAVVMSRAWPRAEVPARIPLQELRGTSTLQEWLVVRRGAGHDLTWPILVRHFPPGGWAQPLTQQADSAAVTALHRLLETAEPDQIDGDDIRHSPTRDHLTRDSRHLGVSAELVAAGQGPLSKPGRLRRDSFQFPLGSLRRNEVADTAARPTNLWRLDEDVHRSPALRGHRRPAHLQRRDR